MAKVFSTFLGSASRRTVARIVIASHEIYVDEPMAEPVVFAPDFGRKLAYATDLHQRIYCVAGASYQTRKTTTANGALYSAPSPGGGLTPSEEDTWTIVSGTELGEADCDTTRHVFQTPSLFVGLDYVDLWTWVYQPAGSWEGAFTIVHELWGNFHRWHRAVTESLVFIKPEDTRPHVPHTSIRLLGKHRG